MKRSSYFIIAIPFIALAIILTILTALSHISADDSFYRLITLSGNNVSRPINGVDHLIIRSLKPDESTNRYINDPDISVIITKSDSTPTISGPEELIKLISIEQTSDTTIISIDLKPTVADVKPSALCRWFSIRSSEPLTIALPSIPKSFYDPSNHLKLEIAKFNHGAITLAYTDSIRFSDCSLDSVRFSIDNPDNVAYKYRNRNGYVNMDIDCINSHIHTLESINYHINYNFSHSVNSSIDIFNYSLPDSTVANLNCGNVNIKSFNCPPNGGAVNIRICNGAKNLTIN